jgi:tRNA pseudouridine55 synthase
MKNRRSGILNLDKPLGQTSHDVVERVRALTDVRRVGHVGTLDPLATGVLVVCVGRTATRIAEYLMDEPKTYRAEVQLGVVTDTFDREGRVIARSPVEVDQHEVERAIEKFRGVIEQIPPMYSAVKHRGKPLYRWARRGIEVERQPRRVEIHRLDLVAWESTSRQAQCTLEMECSPGTYVRTLVHDLGQELGCGAYVTGLIRFASGSFRLEDASTLDRLAQAVEEGHWPELLCPVDEALAGRFPALHLDADEARRLCSGQSIRGGDRNVQSDTPFADSHSSSVRAIRDTLARVYDPEGRFLALAAYDAQENVWRPEKVFVSPYPGPQPEDDD